MAQEDEGNKLLLIEEPEARLHTQRQLRVMRYLQEQAKEKGVQIIVTTHSPNLASAIDLDNMVMIQNGHAFSLSRQDTELEPSDYRFLQRFLDATKANLFFARGVMIVEGDAENILLPTLARLLGRDFTEYGVSTVNVGGVGLRRYARIFQRRDIARAGQLTIPVACVTDNPVLAEWKRKNIENYLLVPEAWRRAALRALRLKEDDLFAEATLKIIDAFFVDQNLTLPPGRSWRSVAANVFGVVDGKKILFENPDALFHQLRNADPPLQLIREDIALSMSAEEIHDDVFQFIDKLRHMTGVA